MDTFHEDFTKDLVLCAGAQYHSAPLDHWNPLEIAAPERHLSLGTDSWEERREALENQNPAFAKIESMLHLYFKDSEEEYDTIDEEKEQVWLFAYHWFATYYEYLMDTRFVRMLFYKKYHEAFLALMRRCLRINPSTRPTFRDIAALWMPSREDTTNTKEAKEASPTTKDLPALLPVLSSLPIQDSASSLKKPSAAVPSSRLVLAGARGHNKTRRNLRS